MPFQKPRAWSLPPDNPILDPSDPINQKLLAYFPFDQVQGNLTPELAQKRLDNMILSGNPPLVPGRIGHALSFDGGGSQSLLNGYPNGIPTYPLTMNCWIKPTSYANEECAMVVTNSSSYNAVGLFLEPGGNIKLFSAGGGPDSTVTSTTNQLTAGQWAMISAVCASSTDRRLYINAILADVDTVDHTPINLNQIIVGRLGGQWGAVLFFPGLIDEPRVWTRALNQSELARLYGDTSGGLGLLRPRGRRIQPPEYVQTAMLGVSSAGQTGTPTIRDRVPVSGTSVVGSSADLTLSISETATLVGLSIKGQAANIVTTYDSNISPLGVVSTGQVGAVQMFAQNIIPVASSAMVTIPIDLTDTSVMQISFAQLSYTQDYSLRSWVSVYPNGIPLQPGYVPVMKFGGLPIVLSASEGAPDNTISYVLPPGRYFVNVLNLTNEQNIVGYCSTTTL